MDLTGKLSEHIYAPDLGPNGPSWVHSHLGPEHNYASVAYQSNPFLQEYYLRFCQVCE